MGTKIGDFGEESKEIQGKSKFRGFLTAETFYPFETFLLLKIK